MPKHLEDEHQKALVDWAKTVNMSRFGFQYSGYGKVIDSLYAIPNGGHRNKLEAARMQGLGVKAGVSDLCLPIPTPLFGALYIEMKRPIVKGQTKPRLTDKQKAWGKHMRNVGNEFCVCYHWTEARDAIVAYLKGQACNQPT